MYVPELIHQPYSERTFLSQKYNRLHLDIQMLCLYVSLNCQPRGIPRKFSPVYRRQQKKIKIYIYLKLYLKS